MITTLLRLLICLLLVTAGTAAANPSLRINPLERQLLVDQRGIVTLRIEVSNQTDQELELTEQLQMPPQWQQVNTPAPFYLPPGQRSLRLLHLLIPATMPAGNYPVSYRLGSIRDSNLYNSETLSIRITRRLEARLEVLSQPGSLLAGETYNSTFLISNAGNSAQQYRAKVSTPDRLPLQVEPTTLTLQPGQSETLTVSGQIPADGIAAGNHDFTLEVISASSRFREKLSIPVIASTPQGIGSHHLLQGEINLGYLGTLAADGNQDSELTAQYTARGTLDVAGEHKIGLRINTGHNPEQPFNDVIDQYHLQYQHDQLSINAGHQSFQADRLSGNSLSGVGIEATYHSNNEQDNTNSSLRGYYAQTRDDVQHKARTAAVIARHRIEEQRLELGGSALYYQQDQENDETQQHTLLSGNVRWTGESAHLYGALAYDGEQTALLAETGKQWEDISATASLQRSDAGFAGANPDMEQIQLGAQWHLTDQTRLTGTVRQSRNNLDKDQSREIRLDREQSLRLSHTLNDERRTRLGAGLRHREDNDQRSQATTRQQHSTALFSYEAEFDALSVRAQLEAGERQDALTSSRHHGNKQQLTLSWQADEDIYLAADFNNNNRLDNPARTVSAGVRGEYRLNDLTTLSAYVQQNAGEADRSTAINLGLKKRFRNDHQLAIQFSHRLKQADQANREQDSSLFVNYVMPMDIPLQAHTDIGSVCGLLHHADGIPASRFILMLGNEYAVTDTEGEFCFLHMPAKNYALQLDVTRLQGASYTLGNAGSSLQVDLQPGEHQRLTLTLHPAATISGIVRRQEIDLQAAANNRQELIAGAGIANVTVELRRVNDWSDQGVIRRKTDSNGQFRFPGLQSGQWQITVLAGNQLPKHYRLETTQQTVDASEGETVEVLFNALPGAQAIEKTGPKQGFSVAG